MAGRAGLEPALLGIMPIVALEATAVATEPTTRKTIFQTLVKHPFQSQLL